MLDCRTTIRCWRRRPSGHSWFLGQLALLQRLRKVLQTFPRHGQKVAAHALFQPVAGFHRFPEQEVQLAQGVVSLGEFLKLLERLFQVAFGGDGAAQHLDRASQVEEEVRVAAFLLPGVQETLFGFFEVILLGSLLAVRSGRVKQSFAQVVVAAKLQGFQLYGQALGGQVFL